MNKKDYKHWLEQNITNILKEHEIIDIWNCYFKSNHPIFDNDKYFFENEMGEFHPYDIAIAICNGNYKIEDNYVCLNETEDLISFNSYNDKNSPFNLIELIQYIIEKQNEIEMDFPEISYIQYLNIIENLR